MNRQGTTTKRAKISLPQSTVARQKGSFKVSKELYARFA